VASPITPEPLALDDRPHWQGYLQLVYARHGAETQISTSQVKAPLKVQRPFYPEAKDVGHSVILHTAGGVVGGDRLTIDLHLHPQANALVTTAAAGKIYRTNGLEARQTMGVKVGAGACLEWLPQETIVFEQARYRQGTRVELGAGAIWVGWEIIRFGRTARGERFLAGDWRSQTEVWQQGKPLWIDRQWLPGSQTMVDSPHGLASCPVVGSFALVGLSVEADLVQAVRLLGKDLLSEANFGATRLQSGLLCRYRGHSTIEVRQWFLDIWQLVRPLYLHRSICIPRVWQLGQRC